ncbi:MAG: tRNA pseudouridine(54/55) synthase Pus10 [Thaumarchaeota archaeon]|nr:tRNA pseudouridine(54/55) synthase Pus10 [Nitrososphaerota archaeon]MCL5316931.1 tRNA pseudouridine(54/55) synthase Pus10 [Nitrososphaerota archaeon]
MQNRRSDVEDLLKRYPLCDSCLGRQFSSEPRSFDYASKGRDLRQQAGFTGAEADQQQPCYICGGLLSNLERYVELVLNAVKDYEFSSIIIGAKIPISITEKEDHLRAEMKLRGGETVKTNFTGELNRIISQRLGVEAKHRVPDVTVVIDTLIDHAEVTPRPLYVYGRYVKTQRGIPQKRRRCPECRGEGCPKCDLTGYSTSDSVEQRLSEPLLNLFKAGKVRFTWLGGEDTDSLVLGRGRPFYAEVSEPMVRKPSNLESIMQAVNGAVSLKEFSILEGEPSSDREFTVTVESKMVLDQPVTEDALKNLETAFTGVAVTMTPPGRRSITKKIRKLTAESAVEAGEDKWKRLRLRVECDGGLSIRRFLTGENGEVKPNVAEVLERKVVLDESAPFDILEVGFET